MLTDLKYYCVPSRLRRFRADACHRVTADNVEEVIGALQHGGIADDPQYILSNGPAYAWYDAERPIGFAGVHSSYLQDRIGNIGMVFVEEQFRQRGIAQTLVSAVAEALFCEEGRLPVYGCAIDNLASWHTAERVGFQLGGYTCRIAAMPE